MRDFILSFELIVQCLSFEGAKTVFLLIEIWIGILFIVTENLF